MPTWAKLSDNQRRALALIAAWPLPRGRQHSGWGQDAKSLNPRVLVTERTGLTLIRTMLAEVVARELKVTALGRSIIPKLPAKPEPAAAALTAARRDKRQLPIPFQPE